MMKFSSATRATPFRDRSVVQRACAPHPISTDRKELVSLVLAHLAPRDGLGRQGGALIDRQSGSIRRNELRNLRSKITRTKGGTPPCCNHVPLDVRITLALEQRLDC